MMGILNREDGQLFQVINAVFTNLWQLFSDISTHKDSLKVDPQVLHS